MTQRSNKSEAKSFEAAVDGIESEPLEPIRKVIRELTRPDGTTLRVEVPVYPPFRLKATRASRKSGSS